MFVKEDIDSMETIVSTLSDYNAGLDAEASPGALNEDFIEWKLSQLEPMESDGPETHPMYWLTYARVFELALLCAGNYADHFEFAAAGDLLVNPRLILIHLKKGFKPVKKDRHRNLTEQFRHIAGEKEAVLQWIKRETVPEIVRKPLLVHMHERMERSGCLSGEYLDLVECRMKRIGNAIGFLASWHVTEPSAFYLRIQAASPSEKSLVEGCLCRFDHGIFLELGRDLRRLAVDPCHKSRFLCNPDLSSPESDPGFPCDAGRVEKPFSPCQDSTPTSSS